MQFAFLEQSLSWWQAIILGIIQGLAEFLPISSSGHLQLFETIMGLEDLPRIFDVCLHIGTLAAVFIVFRKELLSIIKKPFQKLTYLILAATVPTVIIAVLIEKLLGDAVTSNLLGYGFMLTGILLYTMEMFPKEKSVKTIDTMSIKDAALIGCVQGVGTLPGVSRSGSTIAGGIFLGVERKTLARFSFLMSIPAVLGAFCWDVLKVILEKDQPQAVQITWLPLILGVIAAFVVGYLAIRYMLRLIANKSFKPFAFYTFILGFLVCLDKFALHLVF